MAKKKKVRVEFRKNRQKRKRANDLTRSYRQDDQKGADAASGERVRAKGDLSRHRTVIQESPGNVSASASADDPVVDAGRRPVDLPAGAGRPGPRAGLGRRGRGRQGVSAAASGGSSRRWRSTAATSSPSGDRVWFRPSGGDEGLIEKVEGRAGTLTRGYRRKEHVIASNVDQLLIVSAFAEPGLKLPLIDRYLIAAEKGGIRPIIVLNKADLVDLAPLPVGDRPLHPARLRDARHLGRRRPGHRPAPRAPRLGRRRRSRGRAGVGKSSLLNAIQPGLNLRVREVAGLDRQGEAHDHDRRADPARRRRLRRRHAGPAPVRALGRRAGRGRGLLRRVPPVHPPVQVPRLLAHARVRLRRQGRPVPRARSTGAGSRATSSSTPSSRSTLGTSETPPGPDGSKSRGGPSSRSLPRKKCGQRPCDRPKKTLTRFRLANA